jgi:hypothetical protein
VTISIKAIPGIGGSAKNAERLGFGFGDGTCGARCAGAACGEPRGHDGMHVCEYRGTYGVVWDDGDEKPRPRPVPRPRAAVGQRWRCKLDDDEVVVAAVELSPTLGNRFLATNGAWYQLTDDGRPMRVWEHVSDPDAPAAIHSAAALLEPGVQPPSGKWFPLTFNGVEAPRLLSDAERHERLAAIRDDRHARNPMHALRAAFQAVAEAMQTERGSAICDAQFRRELLALRPADLDEEGWRVAVAAEFEGPWRDAWRHRDPRQFADNVRRWISGEILVVVGGNAPRAAYLRAMRRHEAPAGPWLGRRGARRPGR